MADPYYNLLCRPKAALPAADTCTIFRQANTVFQLALVGSALTHSAYGYPASMGVGALWWVYSLRNVFLIFLHVFHLPVSFVRLVL